jgi:hypothetical protein
MIALAWAFNEFPCPLNEFLEFSALECIVCSALQMQLKSFTDEQGGYGR